MSAPIRLDAPSLGLSREAFPAPPYLVTLLSPDIHHLAILPVAWTDETAIEYAHQHHHLTQLDTAVALTPTLTVLFAAREAMLVRDLVPTVICLTTGIELPPALEGTTFRLSPDDAARDGALAAFAARHTLPDHTLLRVEPRHGMRAATVDECEALRVDVVTGRPRGLTRCDRCQAWAGQALLATEGSPVVVEIACQCQNTARCAGCGHPLASGGLFSFTWSEADQAIEYHPALSVLRHRCP